MTDSTRCQLLELPAELRNRIYEYALAPTGFISLTSTEQKRFATDPVLAPTLLATCRQIHEEAAKILYNDNTVCIAVDAQDTCWPTISETRLPQRTLEKLHHLFVVVASTGKNFFASFEDVDFKAFSALTSLKTLRIAILRRRDSTRFAPEFLVQSVQELLSQMLERIPAHTSLVYGAQEGSSEHRFIAEVTESRQRSLPPSLLEEIDAEQLSNMAACIEGLQQGSKSGGIDDVFAEYHQFQRRRQIPNMAF